MSAPAVAKRLDAIKARTGINGRDLAQLLNTTPETVSRWQTGRAEPHRERLEQLLTLEWLADQLAEFYPPKEARLWLYAPHRLLQGERPADRIKAGRTEDVLALIEHLRTGAVV